MIKFFLITIGFTITLFANFTRNDNTEIVTDHNTKLEWQDDINTSSITFSWESAIDYCETLVIDGGGWRLPNFNELYSITDESTYSPAMDSIFVNVKVGSYRSTPSYWSSTTYAANTNYAWTIYFTYSYDGSSGKTTKNYVRCVR